MGGSSKEGHPLTSLSLTSSAGAKESDYTIDDDVNRLVEESLNNSGHPHHHHTGGRRRKWRW